MGMTKFDEYGNYKYPDYSNSQYTHDVSTTGGAMMGMTIEELQKYINALRKCAKEHDNDTAYTGHIIVSDLCRDTANLLETVEAIPKADYETRLADLKAILVELQLEIEEKSIIDYDEALYDGGECVISVSEINDIIQQKITALKEVADVT